MHFVRSNITSLIFYFRAKERQQHHFVVQVFGRIQNWSCFLKYYIRQATGIPTNSIIMPTEWVFLGWFGPAHYKNCHNFGNSVLRKFYVKSVLNLLAVIGKRLHTSLIINIQIYAVCPWVRPIGKSVHYLLLQFSSNFGFPESAWNSDVKCWKKSGQIRIWYFSVFFQKWFLGEKEYYSLFKIMTTSSQIHHF